MKKITLLLLASIILLCSCSKKEDKLFTEDGREIIVLAEIEPDSDCRNAVEYFNMSSEDYYIEERDYTLYADELYSGNEKLLMDITHGEKIDIIYTPGLDMETYVGKNLLADIYELIDNDSEVSRDNYADGVLEACEIGGKLYVMPLYYAMDTTIGLTSVWGDDRDTSIDNLISKSEAMGIPPILCGSDDEAGELWTFFRGSSNNYIDFENGECNFTDGRFEQLLKFCGENILLDRTADERREMFADGEALLYRVHISNIADLDEYKSIFGPDIIFMGLPSDIPNYHTLDLYESFSILEGSDSKQGAFEFIKYLTSYEYQVEQDEIGSVFSINKELFNDYVDMELQESIHNFFNEDGTVKIEYRCTEESAEAVIRELSTINSNLECGETIYNIIYEESSSFFAGERSANEVCEVIQNRISTYLSENI